MAKGDPLETLQQMREFAVEARDLAAKGDRTALKEISVFGGMPSGSRN